jgi:hypothetical protein
VPLPPRAVRPLEEGGAADAALLRDQWGPAGRPQPRVVLTRPKLGRDGRYHPVPVGEPEEVEECVASLVVVGCFVARAPPPGAAPPAAPGSSHPHNHTRTHTRARTLAHSQAR